MSVRPVAAVVPAMHTVEGGGFPVRRPFPTSALSHFDPFLLLDHFGPVEWGPGEAIGAPDHPHRGFETVTYLLEGRSLHEDSAGNRGELGPGDVQWMTAGAGVVHSEMPHPDVLANGGRSEGFQLWVNLPRREKMIAPRYQDVPAARIPVARDEGVEVRVIAGEALGVHAVIETRTPILYHHWKLDPGASWRVPVPKGHNVFAYVFRGEFAFGTEAPVGEGAMVAFEREGDAVLMASPAGGELLLIGGVPLREPIARYGPFVMNTQGEIRQALLDWQAGRIGAIDRASGRGESKGR